MEAIILCAGFGRRLRPLTKTIPKPLLKFHNKTLLTHNILKLFEIGTERLFINAYYLSEKIRNFIKDIYGIEIVFYEELEILGTGGGVYSFKNFIKNDFFIITNSDIYHQIDLSKAIKFHIENKAFITLILKDDFKNNVIVENLRVLDFCEEIKKSAYTFTGISIVSKKFFNYLEYKCSLIDGFKKAISNNEKVLGYITSEFWKDALELEIS